MLKFVSLTLFVTLATACLDFEDCGNGEIKCVQITGCTESIILHKGKEVNITVEFVPNKDCINPKFEMTAEVCYIEMDVPGIETDACKFMKCPLKKGVPETFQYTLTIPTYVPNMGGDVTCQLIGDDKEVLACGSIPCDIRD